LNKIFAVAALAGATTFMTGTYAYAAKDDPHKEQNDGCDHGNSGKDCKEDPSPNGKDCEEHGKHGGVNEDHCTTTTTAPGVTTTTVPKVTTTTVPKVTVPTVPKVTVPTVPDVTVPTLPGTTDTTSPEAPRTIAPRTVAPPADQLPTTGTPAEALAVFGAGMLLLGTGIRKLSRI